MGIFILLYWYQCLPYVMLKLKTAFLKCIIKVVKYAVKIVQNTAEICIVM